MVTLGDDDGIETRSPGAGLAESQIERLWHEVCDLYPWVEVASRHAFDDSRIEPEDLATLGKISSVRQAFRKWEAAPGLTSDDRHFLADVDRRLASLEGRAEILVLAVS
jgi:hypothetical protein